MPVSDDYLSYEWRRHGYDHDNFAWSQLSERPAITWPEGKKLAIWVNCSVEFYPLNQRGIPFKVPNGMTMPYPDLRHFSLREYGNRVGIFRVLEAFKQYGVRPTFAVNAQIAERSPYLLKRLADSGEIIAHGWNMDHLHYGGQDRAEESEIIQRTLNTLRQATGQAVRGWLSPAKHQSFNTVELLAEHGVAYCCDWVNDDMPYVWNTATAPVTMLPLSTEIEDQFIMCQNKHSEDSWVEQVKDAFDMLLNEAHSQGGRILALNIHPWLVGQPHRIACLEHVLAYICQHDEVWIAPAGEILEQFHQQAGA